MTPRRLIPYLVIFLILAGTYAGLRWRQESQQAWEEQAKKVFHLQETEISGLSLIRGKEEVRLAKEDSLWRLTAPLNAKADQATVASMLTTLARLRKERVLEVEKDLKPFGLDKPGLVVKFTAQGQPHQVAIGAKVPGSENYYALKDQDPCVLVISRGGKDSLDRQVLALRDKALLSFISGEVKGLKITRDKTEVNLDKTGPQTWRWGGRPDFRVRGDRVEKLIQDLHLAQAKNFLEKPPKNPADLGLVPARRTAITVVTPGGGQSLFLGVKKGEAAYARQGAAGPVMLVDAGLLDKINRTLASLEDRRLWTGDIAAVRQVVWGPPGKTWTARKDQGKDTWQITGPGQAAVQPNPVRLEMALWNFQNLEGVPEPAKAKITTGPPTFVLKLLDQAGQPLLNLEEVGALGKTGVKLIKRAGDKTETALTPTAPFRQWQAGMQRLAVDGQKAGGPTNKSKAAK